MQLQSTHNANSSIFLNKICSEELTCEINLDWIHEYTLSGTSLKTDYIAH